MPRSPLSSLPLALVLASALAACASPEVPLRTRFDQGRTYITTFEHVDERVHDGQTSRTRVLLVLERRIERGGVLGREPLAWRTRVRRVQADIDEPGETLRWDSASDAPAKARFHAILAGATWRVAIDAAGRPTIADVTPNRAALDGAEPDTAQLVAAVVSEAALTAQTLTWLAWQPARVARVGDSWSVPVPGLGAVTGDLTWTVTSVREGEAHLVGALAFPASILDQPVRVDSSRVDAIFDLVGGQLVQLDGAFELTIGTTAAKHRFRVRANAEATSAAVP